MALKFSVARYTSAGLVAIASVVAALSENRCGSRSTRALRLPRLDLLGVDPHLVDPRSVGRERAARGLDGLAHPLEDVEPGLRLTEVHVDHIILERNGERETLAWPKKQAK